jgi:hypothetical protein
LDTRFCRSLSSSNSSFTFCADGDYHHCLIRVSQSRFLSDNPQILVAFLVFALHWGTFAWLLNPGGVFLACRLPIMGLLKVVLFAYIVFGVTGSPLDGKSILVEDEGDTGLTIAVESQAWQSNSTAITSNTANTTSTSEEDHKWTIFAPVTMVSGWDLEIPGATTSSPVTERTQLSLEVPESQASATRTPAPKPIVQPSESSLLIPVATVSGGKTYVTIAPSAHLERPGTILVRPEGGTASPTFGIVGSELVDLPANTGSAAAHHDQHDSGSNAGSNAGSNDTGEQASPAIILVGDTPLSSGGSPVTVDGTTYSLEPTGSAVVINGNTISFSTNSRGQVVPVETESSGQSDSDANDADAEALSKLSVVSATATATGEGAQGTASATSTEDSGNGGSSGTTGSGSSSSNNDGSDDEEVTGTNTSDAPATQSDNAGAAIAADWSLSAVLGAIGVLAVVS